MSWGRLEDSFYDHPKTERASLEALGAWIVLLSYAGRRRRPDFHKDVAIKRVRGRVDLLDELVTVGFLDVVEDAYVLHNWSDYQPVGFASPEWRHENAVKAAIARHEKNGTRAPACEKCKRWKERCPQHRVPGANAARKQAECGPEAGRKQPGAPGDQTVSVGDDSLVRVALPVPSRSRPEHTDPAPAKAPLASPKQPPEAKPDPAYGIWYDWYRKRPTRNGKPFKEHLETFKETLEKHPVNLEAFAQAVGWRLNEFVEDDRHDRSEYLGSLSNFLSEDRWKSQIDPAATMSAPEIKAADLSPPVESEPEWE